MIIPQKLILDIVVINSPTLSDVNIKPTQRTINVQGAVDNRVKVE